MQRLGEFRRWNDATVWAIACDWVNEIHRAMKILYLGHDSPGTTACHRGEALRRIGHEVDHVNPESGLGDSKFARVFHYRTGYLFASKVVHRDVMRVIGKKNYDLCWVDGGQAVDRRLLRTLRKHCGLIMNYNCDDPAGPRDGNRWFTFRRSILEYDLMVGVRPVTTAGYLRLRARKVMRVYMGYDPVRHAPLALTAPEVSRWRSEVAFVGTWMPERGALMKQLLGLGVPLTIFGDRWHKAAEWPQLRAIVRPGSFGEGYVAAVQSARICLGLVSKGNRDEHTQRSAEIPYIGSLFCAERTAEHCSMYAEGKEAIFWSSAEECAAQCKAMLGNPGQAQAIAAAGKLKVVALGLSNDRIAASILKNLTKENLHDG